MRGKPGHVISMTMAIRIIPAHAGQTSGHPAWSVPGTDHPRACGANMVASMVLDGNAGSSPRMRGKPYPEDNEPIKNRIIPAHAGQTTCSSLSMFSLPDHPRACGANRYANMSGVGFPGSSPRMRGKRLRHLVGDEPFRIIPAHAGQTWFPVRPRFYPPDHPRACGANAAKVAHVVGKDGSSPRMRGKRFC